MTAPLPFEPDDDDRLIGRVLSRREVLRCSACRAWRWPRRLRAGDHGPVRRRGGCLGDGRSAASRRGRQRRRRASSSRADRGAVLRRRGLDRSDIRVDTATGSPRRRHHAPARLGRLAGRRRRLRPARGRAGRRLALRRPGVYSDVQGSEGHDFLRGYQHTDANGDATITTIYPGWYSGRAVHIHFKIRTDPAASSGFEFTSQLFFDEAINDAVCAQASTRRRAPPTSATRPTDLPAEPGDDAARADRRRRRLRRTFEIAINAA